MSFDFDMEFFSGGIGPKELFERVLSFAPSDRTELVEYRSGSFATHDVAFYACSYPLRAESRAHAQSHLRIVVDSTVCFRPYDANYNENVRKAFKIAVATMKAFPGDFLFKNDGTAFILLRRGGETFLNVHPDVWDADGPVAIDVPHTKISHDINSPIP
jgi:hypothetical protein